ncbi:MAG: endonuclease V [Chloroflexi bacterium]|nr:endonuclease V [Chloroflexota bacterium]
MKIRQLHDWDLSPKDAVALQKKLATRLVSSSPLDLHRVRTVAGVDVSVKRGLTCACVVVLSFPALENIETVCMGQATSYPYIPGLLTFREGPALVAAFRKLRNAPDVFIFDGMGQMHPRRMGIAAHLGLWLGRPTIGCGKRHFIGEYQQPGNVKGSSASVTYQGEQVGLVLRTRPNVKPIYVSVGHLADIESAVQLLLACTPKFRLPLPIRMAHRAASEACAPG